jgi:GT2 family glycosyltransferase
MNKKIRKLIPESAKNWYRGARLKVLSMNLRRHGVFELPAGERKASRSISVVVAVHDSPDVVRRCLRCLALFGGDAEVIIVDDGSRLQQTKQMLDAACSEHGWKLIRHSPGKGHSRACEAGIAVSSRPYICLLNSDALVTPRSWLGIVRAFEESPLVAVAGPSTSYTPTKQQVMRAERCRRLWTDEQIWSFAERYCGRREKEPIEDLRFAGGFAFFVRRSAWDRAGGFDINLPDYGNEVDLCRRVQKMGHRIVWSKGSYIHHIGSESYSRTLGMDTIRKRCIEADAYMERKTAP